MEFHIFDDPVVWEMGPIPITRTMLTSLGVSLTLTAIAFLFREAVRNQKNGTIATLAEMVVS
ncbi:MAG: hypothetical protein KDA84_04560 [Planctomycetaceae bacterium]|nr:hypothetical protein [Planctomycetaceae bacterium]